MEPAVLLTELLGRLAYLAKIRNAVLLAYEKTSKPRDRVRSSEVAALAAERIGREDSPLFRGDVIAAMKAGGWRCVTTGGVRLWKGVRRR